MSIFKDKSLSGVAEAVTKILEAEKAKMDYDKDGKVESPKAEVLGSRIRAAKAAGKLKEDVYSDKKSFDMIRRIWGDTTVELTETTPEKGQVILEEDIKKNEYHVSKTHKFPTNNEHAVTVKHTESGREHVHSGKGKYLSKLVKSRYNINHHFEDVEHTDGNQIDEAFPTVADGEKSLKTKEGKTSSGTVTKTKTGLVHKRDYKDDDNDADDAQKKSKGYGARQNFKRSTRVNEQLSFTEMLQLYNEAGVEVISKIAPQKVKFGDTEVEVIDANIVNGAVGITVAEEVDNETFTKEVEAQKEKNAGKGKKAEVAKASVQAVKQEAVEQIDEISKETAGKYLTAPQGKGANKYKTGEGKSSYPNADTMLKHGNSVSRAVQRAGTGMSKKPSYYKEEEQLDELSKKTLSSYIKNAVGRSQEDHEEAGYHSASLMPRDGENRTKHINRAVDKLASKKTNEEAEQINEISKKTLGSYIKAASHDVAAKGAFTRHFADKSRAETAEQKHDIARKTMKKADKMQDAGMKRRANMAKAVDRLTKEDVEQLDEKLPASASAGDYIHDFVHSDNAKFAGKSTKERQKMALGAFYAKNKGK